MTTATIGPLTFELLSTQVAALAPCNAIGSLRLEGMEIEVRREGGRRFLILDHRRFRDATDPCWVEVWRCTTRGEAAPPHLLVLADSRRGTMGRSGCDPVSLTALVDSAARRVAA